MKPSSADMTPRSERLEDAPLGICLRVIDHTDGIPARVVARGRECFSASSSLFAEHLYRHAGRFDMMRPI